MTQSNKKIICRRCNQEKNHEAKGLCHSCYNSELASKCPEKRRENGRKNRKKNKDKINIHLKEWKKDNRIKVNAHARAERKIIKIECSLCKSKENLQFHHTNYEKDEGFVVCCKCHRNIHGKYMVKKKI